MPITRAPLALLGLVLLLIGAIAVFMRWHNDEENGEALRMAGQVGIVGELLMKVGEQLSHDSGRKIQDSNSQPFAFLQSSDCCSATTTWGMSAKSLHGAIMCPDAAKEFLKTNKEFMSLGIVMLNSDIFMLKKEEPQKPNQAGKKIGVSHKRQHQLMMAKDTFGAKSNVLPMLPVGLAYALQKNEVDAVVIDLGVAVELPRTSEMLFQPWGKDPVPTQELVLRKSFVVSPAFEDFIKAYNQAGQQVMEKYSDYGLIVQQLSTDF